MNYRSWLRKTPAPSFVQVGARRLAISESRTKWADAEESLLSLATDGDSIAALDAEGNVLRSVIYDSERTEEEPAGPTGAATGEANELFMQSMAKVIAEAHEAGAKRHQEVMNLCFERLYQMAERSDRRLAAMENNYMRAQTALIRAQADLAMAQAAATNAEAEAGGLLPQILPLMAQFGEAAKKKVVTAVTPTPPTTDPTEK